MMVKARVSISNENSRFCFDNNITLSNTINKAIERLRMFKIVIIKPEQDSYEYWNDYDCYVLEESKLHVVVGSEYKEEIERLKSILKENNITNEYTI